MGATRAKWRNNQLAFYDGTTFETVLPVSPVLLYDDFLGTVVNTSKWTEVEVGDSTKAIAASALTYHLHVTAETEEAGIYASDDKAYNLDNGPIFECRLAVHVAPTLAAEVFIGVTNDSMASGSMRILNADEQAKYAAFGYYATLGAGLIPAIRTDDATSDSGIISSAVTAHSLDAYHVFRIDFTNVADVKFFIDGVGVATTTTFNMSAGSNLMVQPMVIVQKNGANAGLCDIYVDYIRIWQATR